MSHKIGKGCCLVHDYVRTLEYLFVEMGEAKVNAQNPVSYHQIIGGMAMITEALAILGQVIQWHNGFSSNADASNLH